MEKREIKFRAWDSGNNCMIRFDHFWVSMLNTSICFSAVEDDLTEVGKDLPGAYGTGADPEADDAYILMQFTGLYDKNGKEIYEGDILNVDCSGVGVSFDDGVYKVEYITPDCAFALIQIDGKHGIPFNECYEYKAIGNIYETNLIA